MWQLSGSLRLLLHATTGVLHSSSVVLCRHEIVGIVVEVGSNAQSHFKLGDRAGIG
jgi:D-arabinose 1-dehydrogenase-like Zn-dependent alcohol dehydrogenase